MKLHLPYGLRKALLACLAAMTVSLPATLGTASGWAAVWFAASRVAQAGETPPASEQTDEEDSEEYMLLSDAGAVPQASGTTLTWNTANGDNTWGDGHNNWGSDQAWSGGSDAVFSDETGETVTISGTVAAGNVSVEKGTWTFTVGETDSLGATGSITVGSADGTAAHVTSGGTGAVSSKGLTLQGEGTTVKFSGAGTKNFGGSADSPGIHLGAGTELVIAAGGDGNWDQGGGNYVEGEGSIVLEGVNVTNSGGDSKGLLFAFFDAGDSGTGKSIGALKLRSDATLTMSGEMAGKNIGDTGHSLGYFKKIFVEAGSTLKITSGALGYKKHEGNKLHLAGTGADDAGALIINYDASGDKAPNQQINWDIVADADTLISIKQGNKTFNGALDAQGNTLTIKMTDGQTTTLAQAFTAGSKDDGTKGTLELSGGTVVLGDGFSMEGSEGTLKVSGGTVSSEQDVTLGNVALNSGTLALSNGGTVSSLSGSGTLQVNGGTLTLTTVDSLTLTNLALGQGSTAGNLVVNSGSFGISDGWTWVDGSSLTLGTKGQVITLSGQGKRIRS